MIWGVQNEGLEEDGEGEGHARQKQGVRNSWSYGADFGPLGRYDVL